MAVPTISSVSPTTGQAAGGNLVTIVGTNFRFPTMAYTIPMEELTPTVRVLINGVACAQVEVISATLVKVLMPRYMGDPFTNPYPAVNVTVYNLDDSGNPIAGENVTAALAYTYQRWTLAPPRQDPPLLQVLKPLMQHLLREVCKDVVTSTSVDFGEQGTAVLTDIATLPSISLNVSFPEDKEWTQWNNEPVEVEQGDTTANVYRGMKTHKIVLDLTLAGSSLRELLHLASAVQDFALTNPEFVVDADPTVYAGLTDSIPLEISSDFAQATGDKQGDLFIGTMQLEARGIPVLPDQPVENVKKIAQFMWVQSDYSATEFSETTF